MPSKWKLRLVNPQLIDTGRYTCLLVHKDDPNLWAMHTTIFDIEEGGPEAPRLINRDEDIIAYAGDNVTLLCELVNEYDPTPSRDWYKLPANYDRTKCEGIDGKMLYFEHPSRYSPCKRRDFRRSSTPNIFVVSLLNDFFDATK